MYAASIPAVFGHALMEKYPDIVKDIFEMDNGLYFFMMGLPSWFPWPGVMQAHLARLRVWRTMDDHQRTMDAHAEGKDMDSSWGDLDDVSDFIVKRNEIFRGKSKHFSNLFKSLLLNFASRIQIRH
jgi:hypothetical protein